MNRGGGAVVVAKSDRGGVVAGSVSECRRELSIRNKARAAISAPEAIAGPDKPERGRAISGITPGSIAGARNASRDRRGSSPFIIYAVAG